MHAHVVECDAALPALEYAGSDQPPDVRSFDPEHRQAFREKTSPIWFLDPPSERIDRVDERSGHEPERASVDDCLLSRERMETQV
jgi:hypothetical protein